MERERDRISSIASKTKSVESLPANIGAGEPTDPPTLVVREPRPARTQSVSSDNVTVRSAAATATSAHRKQQSLDNMRFDKDIKIDHG